MQLLADGTHKHKIQNDNFSNGTFVAKLVKNHLGQKTLLESIHVHVDVRCSGARIKP